MNTIDFGLAPYREIWEMQRKLQNELIAKKKEKKLIKNEYLLVGEHFPVYTLGKLFEVVGKLVSTVVEKSAQRLSVFEI